MIDPTAAAASWAGEEAVWRGGVVGAALDTQPGREREERSQGDVASPLLSSRPHVMKNSTLLPETSSNPRFSSCNHIVNLLIRRVYIICIDIQMAIKYIKQKWSVRLSIHLADEEGLHHASRG